MFVQHSNSKESIFQLNFSTESSTTGNRGSWIFAPQNSTAGISWGRIRISKAFHDYLKGTYPDDPRYSATVLSTWVNKSNGENQFAYPKLSYKEGRVTHNVEINYSICNDPTNPTVEGDATASYIAALAKRYNISVSKLASGVPLGGDLDNIDEQTIAASLAHRRPY